jgi:hypothetical protein
MPELTVGSAGIVNQRKVVKPKNGEMQFGGVIYS